MHEKPPKDAFRAHVFYKSETGAIGQVWGCGVSGEQLVEAPGTVDLRAIHTSHRTGCLNAAEVLVVVQTQEAVEESCRRKFGGVGWGDRGECIGFRRRSQFTERVLREDVES